MFELRTSMIKNYESLVFFNPKDSWYATVNIYFFNFALMIP